MSPATKKKLEVWEKGGGGGGVGEAQTKRNSEGERKKTKRGREDERSWRLRFAAPVSFLFAG